MKRKTMKANRNEVTAILTRPYSRVLVPQEGGRFSAEILEFPGCFAEGATAESAYRSLEDAAEAWVLACVAGGMAVPEPLTNYEVSGKFALRLPRSLYMRATKVAAKEGVSLNQFIANAIAERLGAQDVADRVNSIFAELRARVHLVELAATSPSAGIPGFHQRLEIQQSASTLGKAH